MRVESPILPKKPIAVGQRSPYVILLPVLMTIVLLAWVAMWWLEQSSYFLLFHDHGSSGHAMHSSVPGWLSGFAFIAGWVLMTLAMMLPTTLPLVVRFQTMVAKRDQAGLLISLLIVGYLAAWLGFGVVALASARVMIWAAGMTGWLAERAWISGAVLFLLAGAFQFTPLKYTCLDKCRSPTGFLMSYWHGLNPFIESFNTGWRHGIFCVGCCWALMLLMYAIGAASLAWMLVLAIIMAMEKNMPWGHRISRPIGAVLLATGILLGAYNVTA